MQQDPLGFPIKPYAVQVAFAERLRDTLSHGKLGIFESPTGTGKSLSILCGSLSWLTSPEAEQSAPVGLPPAQGDWVAEAARERALQARQRAQRDAAARREALRKRLLLVRHGVEPSAEHGPAATVCDFGDGAHMRPAKRHKGADNDSSDDLDDSVFCLSPEATEARDNSEQSQESGGDGDDDDDDDEGYETQKVLYCSRTHSQLAQFVGEFRRTRWADTVTMACLASRKQLCIEDAATGHGTRSAAGISEACADLRERRKCHFKTSGRTLANFRDKVLAIPMDIEDLVRLGKETGCCPYFGVRAAVHQAQLVVLPYQMVLHTQTRESVGIKLEGNAVVFDEAHNVAKAVNDVHSAELSLADAESSLQQLVAYRDRFLRVLGPKNLVRVKQLINLAEGLCGLFKNSAGDAKLALEDSLVTTNEFVFAANVDAFNTFELVQFCDTSRIAFKVNGLAEMAEKRQKREAADPAQHILRRKPPPVLQLAAFLRAISNPDDDGRVLIRRTTNTETGRAAGLKYLLLNPERHFREIVTGARSVVLAGGTLQPLQWLLGQLLEPAQMPRVEYFSCGHVIPPGNLQLATLCAGPTGVTFEFTYANRSSTEMLDELGRALTNFCNIVPDGFVCFLPSYAFMDAALQRWEASGTMLALERKKRLFKEPREPGLVAAVLEGYRTCIDAKTGGALLFSVVGGKMSEGINFADGYGRCVMVVGMPYPNVTDPVVAERARRSGNQSGFLDDLCMRAVNQTIGRAIRHAADFALVVLADCRFTRQTATSRLPRWMADCLPFPPPTTFAQTFALSAKFFAGKKQQQQHH